MSWRTTSRRRTEGDRVLAGRATERPPTLRRLWAQVYGPNLLVSIGQGAVVPVLALAARDLGASPSAASLVVAMNGLGTLAFDVPAGWIVGRFGERRAGEVASAMLVGGVAIAVVARSTWELAAGVLVAAGGWSIWLLLRLTYMTRATPVAMRGRALSVLGGVMRLGNVVGPLLLVAVAGSRGTRVAFVIYLASAVLGSLWLLVAWDRSDPATSARAPGHLHPGAIVREHQREFATAGLATFAISLLRASRQVVIPLWGAHVGLDAAKISLIFAISSIIDLAGFYPAGVISDRFGRVAVTLPCLLLLSVGFALVPMTHAYDTLLGVALISGAGNGLGSGIVMTLGADRAPVSGRAAFLAVWRLVSDTGTTGGPLIVAGVITVVSLALTGPVLAVVGLGAAVVAGGFMRDPLPRPGEDPG